MQLELQRLGAADIILSTNLPLRQDGEPYSNMKPDGNDKGVAVYFQLNGCPTVFCCDAWDRIEANMHSVALTIAAMRGIDRWKCSDMMKRMFSGFVALPESTERDPYQVLSITKDASPEKIRYAWAVLTRQYHPDNGSAPDRDKFEEVQNAYNKLRK